MVTRLYRYHFRARKGLILQYNDGFGEIAPLPGWSRESLREALTETISLLPHLPSAQPKLPSVQFGLSCALRPFSMAPLRIPLCALHRPRPDDATLKLKVGHLPIEAAIAHIRQYVGKFRLRIDCNRAWTLDQALQFAKHFSPNDFEYLEEPVHPFADLVRFSSLTRFPIAIDESLRDSSPILAIPTLTTVVIKPTLMGTLPTLPPHLSCVLSSSYETSLGIVQIARLANENMAQGLDTFADDLLIPPLRVEKGHLLWNPSPTPVDLRKLCLIAIAH